MIATDTAAAEILLTPGEAAVMLGISTTDLAAWADFGAGPDYLATPAGHRYPLAALRHYRKTRWITPAECARRLAVSPRTLEGWRSRGEGPPYHRIGNRPRYDHSDVAVYLATCRQGGMISIH